MVFLLEWPQNTSQNENFKIAFPKVHILVFKREKCGEDANETAFYFYFCCRTKHY